MSESVGAYCNALSPSGEPCGYTKGHDEADSRWYIERHTWEEVPIMDELEAERLRELLYIATDRNSKAASAQRQNEHELARLRAELEEVQRMRWHHNPDAPAEHICEDCDRLRAALAQCQEALRRPVYVHMKDEPSLWTCHACGGVSTGPGLDAQTIQHTPACFLADPDGTAALAEWQAMERVVNAGKELPYCADSNWPNDEFVMTVRADKLRRFHDVLVALDALSSTQQLLRRTRMSPGRA